MTDTSTPAVGSYVFVVAQERGAVLVVVLPVIGRLDACVYADVVVRPSASPTTRGLPSASYVVVNTGDQCAVVPS